MSRIPPPLLALTLLPGLTSCAAVAAAGVVGVGFVQYQRNELQQDFPLELARTWQATLEALHRLGIEPALATLGPTEGEIRHEDLALRVERHPEGFTRVRVRVGSFQSADHERRAQLVLAEIENALKESDELQDWTKKVEALAEPETPEPPAPE